MADIAVPGDGFEKIIMGISNGLAKTEYAVASVAYGSNDPLGGIKFPGNKAKTRGLINILREINKIDLCNVINYALGQIRITDGVIGEKVKKVHDLAKSILDILDLQFLDPTSIKQDDAKIALLIGYLAEIDELIDSEIVSVFPKIQDYKTTLNSLVTFLIQYRAAVKSYELLRNATEEALKFDPNGRKLDKAATTGNVIVTVESSRLDMGDEPDLVGYTDLEVPMSTLNALGRAYSSRERIIFQQVDLSQIPIAEVQKLMRNIRDVKAVLQAIMAVTSVNDLASLIIPDQIQELQKIVNPSRLIPHLRTILNYTRGLNQIAQQVLGYASVAKTIIKVITVIIKVVQIAIQIFRLLPMPLMFATAGIMDALVWARQLLDGQLEAALKRVSQLGKLIDIIYTFANNVAGIIQEVVIQIEILIYNLEVCSPSPIVAQMKEIKGQLQESLENLKNLSSNYEKAKKASNETTYNGYIFRIEEEQVEEESITSFRRRAIAFDSSNIMVMATDLTFATDKNLLFEELRLKLVNNGLISDTGNQFNSVTNILNSLGLPESTDEIYASLGYAPMDGINTQDLMKSEMSAVQKQINSVISNIKGGDDLRKISTFKTLSSNEILKQEIKSGKANPVTSQPTTAGMPPANNTKPTPSKKSLNPDILTDAEVQRLENLIRTIESHPNAKGLIQTQQYLVAKEKLKKNAAARLAVGM